MAANLLDGRTVAGQMRGEIAQEVAAFVAKHGRAPGLAVLLVGEDPASKVYVRRIGKSCEEVGVAFQLLSLPGSVDRAELQARIRQLNEDPAVSGVLVQLPLPKPLTQDMVTEVLSPAKDVDGISPISAGRLFLGEEGFVANTPAGGMELLRRYGVERRGAQAVVVGRSAIVGKPMAMLLLAEHATVTICHSRTRDLAAVARTADILVAAIGQPRFITADMVKPGAAVVDFGINPAEKGIVGDVDFEAVKEMAGWLTPVPGGTGPMTNMMLLRNTLAAAGRAAGG